MAISAKTPEKVVKIQKSSPYRKSDKKNSYLGHILNHKYSYGCFCAGALKVAKHGTKRGQIGKKQLIFGVNI